MGTALITGAGLVATPSPGSIFAYLAVTPRGGYVGVLAAIVVAAGVSFVVGAALLGFGRGRGPADPEPAPATSSTGRPAAASADNGPGTDNGSGTPVAEPSIGAGSVAAGAGSTALATQHQRTIAGRAVRSLVVACDAGMGSSVMLASQMRERLARYDVTVEHVPVNSIPPDAQVVLCHADLADRARGSAPGAVVVPFRVFLGDPAFDEVEAAIRDGGELRG